MKILYCRRALGSYVLYMRYAIVLSAFAFAGCASLPAAPAARPDTEIQASFGRSWDAVVDYFARSSIPIKTIDRSSGLIAAETQRLAGDNSPYAKCSNGFFSFQAEGASFNALIRGDSTHSTVRVTANWIPVNNGGITIHCQTTDVWEKQFESAIKEKAEAK